MISKIILLIIVTVIEGFVLNASANNGNTAAIMLRRTLKDDTGVDLALLSDIATGKSDVDWHQSLQDKLNDWHIPIKIADSTAGSTGSTQRADNAVNDGSTPATAQPAHSLPTFDWSLEEEDNPVKGTRTRYAEGIARLSDGTLIEGRAQVSHTYYDGNKNDLEYGQDFKVDFMLTAFNRGGEPKDFISEKNNDGVALISSEIKVGNNPSHTNGTFERHSNQITISFYDLDKFDKLIGYNPSAKRRVEGGTGAQQLVGALFGGLAQLMTANMHENASEYSGGTLDQLAKSDAVVVELAFADGSKGYVDLAPQNINLVALTVPLFKAAVPADTGNGSAAREGMMAAKPNWCSRATTAVEILICDTPKLAAADIKIAAIYTALKNGPNPPVLLGKGMTAFLTQRNACQSITAVPGKIDCIDGVYAKWIGILQSH